MALALLVEDVTLLKQRQATAQVRFRGGATTTLTLPRPMGAERHRCRSALRRWLASLGLAAEPPPRAGVAAGAAP